MDTVLPFGMRSAPKISMQWQMPSSGFAEMRGRKRLYITWMTSLFSEHQTHRSAATTSSSVFQRLGVPIAEHKTAGPSSKIIFLGVEIDSQQLTLRLPEEKLVELRALISLWLYKKVAVARNLKSVVGKLENACKVVRPGRSFLRRMLDLLRGVHSNRRLIRLSEAFRSDLMWWHMFLDVWNGVSMIPFGDPQLHDVVVHMDASGNLGCAAWWPDGWLQYSWPPEMVKTHSTPEEALPIVLACAVWGEEWDKKIHVYCNNEAAVISLNSGSSRSTAVQRPSTAGDRLGVHPTGLDVGQLGAIIQQLFLAGIADSTRNTYRSGSDRYIRLCATLGITPFPVSERSLSLFAASLYRDGLAGSTAKTRHPICTDFLWGNIGSMPHLEYVLKGFRKLAVGKPRPRLPMTPPILMKMWDIWSRVPERGDASMLWAASCMCFFLFLRSGEIVVPSDGAYDSSVHLSYGDV
eukprot:Em0003g930a